MTMVGNISLLKKPMQGFLCSRTARSSIILPCLDWAVEMAKGEMPVISTFHSKMEKSVLEVLLAGKCPIVMVLGRKLYKEVPEMLQQALKDGRMLMVSLSEQTRISQQSALACNRFIMEHAQEVVVGFAAPGGNLEMILESNDDKKQIRYITR